jgi:predicted amino acid dehydrogenase
MAAARDGWKKINAQIMLFIHKKSKNLNQQKKTQNQYFPHISFVASKKHDLGEKNISVWHAPLPFNAKICVTPTA